MRILGLPLALTLLMVPAVARADAEPAPVPDEPSVSSVPPSPPAEEPPAEEPPAGPPSSVTPPPPPDPAKTVDAPRSTGTYSTVPEWQRGFGIVLCLTSVASFVAAGALLVQAANTRDFGAVIAPIAAFPAAGGVLLAAVGIPLWVDAQGQIDRRITSGRPAAPRLAISPGREGVAVSLGGTF